MKKKVILTLFVFLWVFVLVSRVDAIRVHDGYLSRMYFEVYAPRKVKVGEEFSVTFVIKPVSALNVDKISVGVSSFFTNPERWNHTWEDMTMHAWKNGVGGEEMEYRATVNLTATAISSGYSGVGTVWGSIFADYHAGEENPLYSYEFQITKVLTKTPEEFQDDYDILNQNYENLQRNYNSLRKNLDLYQTLTLSFIITTVVFISTTVYFARRKPKTIG